jgi:hypothetical protein
MNWNVSASITTSSSRRITAPEGGSPNGGQPMDARSAATSSASAIQR